jgi:hypothetical protein
MDEQKATDDTEPPGVWSPRVAQLVINARKQLARAEHLRVDAKRMQQTAERELLDAAVTLEEARSALKDADK